MALTRIASISSHKQNIHPIEHSNNNRQMQSGNLGIWAIGEFGNLGDRELGRSVNSLANRANAIRPYDTPHFSNADRNADGPIWSISNDRPDSTMSNASKNALTPSAGLVG